MNSQCDSGIPLLTHALAFTAAAWLVIAAPGVVAGGSPGDVSGDGIGDLMVGVPGEDVSGWVDAGIVAEMRGSEYGFSPGACVWWTPDFALVDGDAGHDEYFGEALAMGDFNGDGFTDVAIGITGEDYSPGSINAAGAVHILYGHSGGLSVFNQQVFDQGVAGIAGEPEEDDFFGMALAAGDFDADGFADLVVGSPYEDSGALADSGLITVLYGSASGLTTTGSQVIDQSHSDLPGAAEAGDRFGSALATGDFNGDGNCDLAVASEFEDIGTVLRAGAVHVLYGGSSGLMTTGSQMYYQGTSSIADSSETDDHFGASLATGHFNDDGFADLAVGIPGEDIEALSLDGAGAVAVIWGSVYGLTGANDQHLTESDCGEGTSEAGDSFGAALAAGDFNGDDISDLAIGAPGQNFDGSSPNAGAVTVLYGTDFWFQSTGNQLWFQGEDGLLGEAENGDGFGASLAAGEFNGDRFADLAIGAPSEDLEGSQDAGAISIMYGTEGGLVSAADEYWSQQTLGWTVEYLDLFGYSLAAIAGPPRIFFDGFESGDTNAW
jgi:hypothetical protein